MPPELVGTLAAAGTNFAENLFTQGTNMLYNDYVYRKQKKDAIEFWKMQNEYNTPANQMKRFAEAGLNPNLIYGKMGDNSASQLKVPGYQGTQMQSTRSGDTIMNYVNLERTRQETNNLKKQGDVLEAERLLKEAQTRNLDAGSNLTTFNLGLEQDLRDVSIETRKEQLRQITNSIMNSITDTETRRLTYQLQEAKNPYEIGMIKSNILRNAFMNATDKANQKMIYARVKEIKESTEMMKYENRLRASGLSYNDPLVARLTSLILGGDDLKGKSSEEQLKIIKGNLKSLGETWFDKLKEKDGNLFYDYTPIGNLLKLFKN